MTKLCLRPWIAREKKPGRNGHYWLLELSCGHSVKRNDSNGGSKWKKVNCEECYKVGERTVDKRNLTNENSVVGEELFDAD